MVEFVVCRETLSRFLPVEHPSEGGTVLIELSGGGNKSCGDSVEGRVVVGNSCDGQGRFARVAVGGITGDTCCDNGRGHIVKGPTGNNMNGAVTVATVVNISDMEANIVS